MKCPRNMFDLRWRMDSEACERVLDTSRATTNTEVIAAIKKVIPDARIELPNIAFRGRRELWLRRA